MSHKSLEEVHGSIDTTQTSNWYKRLFLFIGPAFLVAVGYMDPGNWATDIAGGSKYGYSLLWVLLMSNLIALLLQSFCVRIGIVRGKDLAQLSRETYSKPVNFSLYILAEIAIAACDLAEVLGMAIGLNLLFGIPLLWGVGIAVLDTFIILYLQSKGMRYLEAFILALVAIISLSFFAELYFAKPHLSEVASGFLPSIKDKGALYIAIGIIGATVMPHNLYLHSSLVQTRRNKKDEAGMKQAIKYNIIDSAIALNAAFFVNAAILVLAATVFYKQGYHDVVEIQDAYRMLEPLLGEKLAPMLFAIALIAAGQSSTITGTLAGQIVMEGYLDLRIAPWLRRLITRMIAVVPAVLVIYFLGEDKVGDMLIFSQVLLSLQLGFAVIPLIHFVSDKAKMGVFTISTLTKILAWVAAAIIIGLNFQLVIETIAEWRTLLPQQWLYYGVILPIITASVLLLLYIIVSPFIGRKETEAKNLPHGTAANLPLISAKTYNRIGICVDFSSSDVKAIEHGIAQGSSFSEYFLIHVTESAGARAVGIEISDYETSEDWKQLQLYVASLKIQGYKVDAQLGFGNPGKSIPRLAEMLNLEMLVLGSHGHNTFYDLLYGETITEVRHRVKCPVLIV